jgi:DNA repair exonuclease SbcCD ATPase subunit
MKELTLSRLSLKNFKGIKKFVFSPMGVNATALGDNATGKTTLIDSFTWLLFNSDSQGKTAFQLKPVDQDGQEIHNLETEVEGILDINNKPVTLKKRFYEKYTKKRGQAMAEFTGHTTDHFIDDVPAKKGEFDSKVAEILDMNAFKLVTNPMEFNQLHWTGRRQILLEMCGDVTDQDVIDSDSKLSTLAGILGKSSIDDHKKKIMAKKREINRELEQIPVRISENQEQAKHAVKTDPKEKTRLEKKLEEQKEALRALVSNEALSLKRVRLNEINGEIQKIKNEADQKQAGARKPILDQIAKMEAERRELAGIIQDAQFHITQDEKRNAISKDAIEKVRERWYAEDKKQPAGDNTCPTCGQDLPADQVQDTIRIFNKMKSDRLEKISAEGKELKTNISQREKDININKVSIDTNQKLIVNIDKAINAKKAELEKVYVPVNADALDKERDAVEMEIKAIMNGSSIQEQTARERISEAQANLDAWNQLNAEYKAAESARARIAELENQEKILAAEFERLESELFLIEKFIISKVEMLESRINGMFKLARFKLFETQINEGIKECCEILFDGVPFNSGLNNAARINVGLDIISILSEHYGFKAPVWIDNKESINEIIPMDCQVISLVVSRDQELTVMETEALKAS